jgi:hypothetical protein
MTANASPADAAQAAAAAAAATPLASGGGGGASDPAAAAAAAAAAFRRAVAGYEWGEAAEVAQLLASEWRAVTHVTNTSRHGHT